MAYNFLFKLECGLEFSTPGVCLRLIFFIIISTSNKFKQKSWAASYGVETGPF